MATHIMEFFKKNPQITFLYILFSLIKTYNLERYFYKTIKFILTVNITLRFDILYTVQQTLKLCKCKKKSAKVHNAYRVIE